MQNKLISFLAILSAAMIIIACNNSGNNKKTNDTIISSQDSTAIVTGNTIPATLENLKDHKKFLSALKSGRLLETLNQPGPFTVFAPTDEAFDQLPPGWLEEMMNVKKEALTNIVAYHIVAGSLKNADLKDGEKLKTLQGNELTVTIKPGDFRINGIPVTRSDIGGGNGVIHVVDAVLIPAGM